MSLERRADSARPGGDGCALGTQPVLGVQLAAVAHHSLPSHQMASDQRPGSLISTPSNPDCSLPHFNIVQLALVTHLAILRGLCLQAESHDPSDLLLPPTAASSPQEHRPPGSHHLDSGSTPWWPPLFIPPSLTFISVLRAVPGTNGMAHILPRWQSLPCLRCCIL